VRKELREKMEGLIEGQPMEVIQRAVIGVVVDMRHEGFDSEDVKEFVRENIEETLTAMYQTEEVKCEYCGHRLEVVRTDELWECPECKKKEALLVLTGPAADIHNPKSEYNKERAVEEMDEKEIEDRMHEEQAEVEGIDSLEDKENNATREEN